MIRHVTLGYLISMMSSCINSFTTVQVKFECKEVDPLVKTAELYTFRLIILEL